MCTGERDDPTAVARLGPTFEGGEPLSVPLILSGVREPRARQVHVPTVLYLQATAAARWSRCAAASIEEPLLPPLTAHFRPFNSKKFPLLGANPPD